MTTIPDRFELKIGKQSEKNNWPNAPNERSNELSGKRFGLIRVSLSRLRLGLQFKILHVQFDYRLFISENYLERERTEGAGRTRETKTRRRKAGSCDDGDVDGGINGRRESRTAPTCELLKISVPV